jgi:hypothetical protein
MTSQNRFRLVGLYQQTVAGSIDERYGSIDEKATNQAKSYFDIFFKKIFFISGY